MMVVLVKDALDELEKGLIELQQRYYKVHGSSMFRKPKS